MSERRPSDRPERPPVFVYGGPNTVSKGIKEVPAWYAKYQPQQQQQQQQPPDNLASPPPSESTMGATGRPSSSASMDEARPRHASTGSIDIPPNSPSDAGSVSGGPNGRSMSRRSSSGSTAGVGTPGGGAGSIFPSLKPEPTPPQHPGGPQRRDSMGRLFTGLTTQKRESGDVRRDSWNEQKTVMGSGMERMVGGWWDGWLRGGSGSASAAGGGGGGGGGGGNR